MRRLNNIVMTGAMSIDTKAKSLSKEKKIYNLSAGDPNLPLQKAIVDAYNNIDIQDTHNYCSSQGLLELREKISEHPEQVIISNGTKELIYLALRAITNPFDKVVIIGPCWPSYMRICDILHLDYQLVIGDESNNYIPTLSQIQPVITDETAAILINNPNNPTGVAYDYYFTDYLYEAAKKHNCYIISDEIYKDFVYNKRHRSYNTYCGEYLDRVIVIDGFSKSYSLTGWRLGYAISNVEVIKSMTNFQSQISGPPNTLVQKIIADCYDKLEIDINSYRERISLLADIFPNEQPQAGFYYYIKIGDQWKSSIECCNYMLDNYGIAIIPGDEYGIERTVRLSIANITLEDLKEIKDKLVKIV